MSLYRDEAIVLRTYKLGEADRIVVLATRANGKVRAVAKGVRKTKSRFGARLEPTSHVSLLLYEGRDLDIVTQADSIDHFREIREDLDRISQASAMLEAVEQLLQERQPNARLFTMLLRALRTLADHDSPLVVPAFFLKVLALEGLQPVVDRCVACDHRSSGDKPDDHELVAFDIDEGGLLCVEHRRGMAVSPAGVRLLRLILGGQLGAALNEGESAATNEIEHLSISAVEHHLERRLRSVSLLHAANRS